MTDPFYLGLFYLIIQEYETFSLHSSISQYRSSTPPYLLVGLSHCVYKRGSSHGNISEAADRSLFDFRSRNETN